MVLPETAAGLGIFKSLYDTAKGLLDLKDAAALNEAVIGLQKDILTAQAEQMALVKRVGELEKEVAGYETWEAEKERYELVQLPPGVYIRSIKESMCNDEPPHYICVNCYERDIKSILQSKPRGRGMTRLTCGTCGESIDYGHLKPLKVDRRGPRKSNWMS